MSSKTLSVVLEKQIRHLCLTDFPCGNGSWKKTKDGADRAETEEMDTLLDLLTCTHSPWWHEESWSPQAPALRRLAVLTPDCLTTDFIYNYFTTLRIVNKDVSVIDDGLLKFSKLKELVLSVNKISEISAENLPSTLKEQQTLLNALSTLPGLKTLVLEGNPFTLASSYPGVTVDSLPRVSYLDASWISPDERCRFRGLADMRISRHSTPKLAWSENMDFADTKTYIVSDLGALKKFLSQGLYLCLEEEKVLSRPAASYPVKPSQNVKDMKGRKTKEDMGKIIKDDKKEDDKGSKLPVGSGTGQKNRASLKGKVNEKDYEVDTDSSVSVQLEPVTVEFSVGLMKLQCASEAHYKPPTTQSLF
ncbi:Leucine-rich repeat-containing protein 43 [Channa argus]|uniref:Leucine-rich repeat-containing protein 43 n=1 Tax=Channa argus TaxID=215402 RepID=A0A6G1Q0I5_CHAAH|nr:Leucine-rich repeat-containing protein 43 [Channa argus]